MAKSDFRVVVGPILQQYQYKILCMILYSVQSCRGDARDWYSRYWQQFFHELCENDKKNVHICPNFVICKKPWHQKRIIYLNADYKGQHRICYENNCFWNSLNACPKNGAFSSVLLNYYLQIFKIPISSIITVARLLEKFCLVDEMYCSLVDAMQVGG
jgi:hypothetical protein